MRIGIVFRRSRINLEVMLNASVGREEEDKTVLEDVLLLLFVVRCDDDVAPKNDFLLRTNWTKKPSSYYSSRRLRNKNENENETPLLSFSSEEKCSVFLLLCSSLQFFSCFAVDVFVTILSPKDTKV